MSDVAQAWEWRHAVCKADLQATTKHVLLTLSCWMNAMGRGCYPSIADLVEATGRDKKTVLKHLNAAADAGWIVVEQHGYRGRKWRRNEYCARWPERDLTAGSIRADEVSDCGDDGLDEGADEGLNSARGGGVTPPPQENEVVESCPRGGGVVPPEVVEPLHHVIRDQSNTSPVTSPVERERASADASGTGEGEPEQASATPATWKARFNRAHRDWPTFVSDSGPEAEKAWNGLSAAERLEAADRAADFVAECRKAGRQRICSFAVYLRERRWTKLPDRDAKPAEPLAAPAFGPVWAAVRLARLIEPNPARDDDGFPLDGFVASVRAIDASASRGAGLAAKPGADAGRWERLAALMGPVAVGSDAWAWWQDEFRRRGWLWLPDPGRQAWVYFPRDVEAFVRAVSGETGQAAE